MALFEMALRTVKAFRPNYRAKVSLGLVMIGVTLVAPTLTEFVAGELLVFLLGTPRGELSKFLTGSSLVGMPLIVVGIGLAIYWGRDPKDPKARQNADCPLPSDGQLLLPVHPFYRSRRLLDGLSRKFPASGLALLCDIAVLSVAVAALVVLYVDAASMRNAPRLLFFKWANTPADFWNEHSMRCSLASGLCLSLLVRFLLRNRSATDSSKMGRINRILDKFHLTLSPNGCEFEYRLTLFRSRKSLVFGMWNGICARSGDTHQKFTTIRALDTEDPKLCTGAAGAAWWRAAKGKSAAKFTNIENLLVDDSVEVYAEKCGLALSEARSLTHRSNRFLAGAIIVDGKTWGVLVFDTDSPDWAATPSASSRIKKDFEMAMLAISWVLQK